MAGRATLPEGVRIWAGWMHLFVNVDELDAPAFQTAMLDVGALDKKQESTLAKLHRIEPSLFELGAVPKKHNREEAKMLLTKIGSVAEVGRRFWLKRRFLEVIEGAEEANRFDIHIPYLPAPLPDADPSPFQVEDEERLAKMRPLIRGFYASLDDSSDLEPDAWWGRVLMSAMINGALLKTGHLCALPEAVLTAEPELRWLDLRLSSADDGQVSNLPHRWFPDPCTRLLLARGRQLGDHPSVPVLDLPPYRWAYKLMRAYAGVRGMSALMPNGINELAKALTTRLHHHVPAWMVSHATERQPCVSLPVWAWDRLINPPTRLRLELTKREQLVATLRGSGVLASKMVEVAEDESQWPRQLRKLAEHVREPDETRKKSITEWRENGGAALLPSVRLISEWVTDWLMIKGTGRKVLSRRGIYAMTNAIGGRLVGQLGHTDILELKDPDAYVEIYNAAMEDTGSTNVRATVANALRSFHDYLVARRKAPKVSAEIFAVGGRLGGSIDANLIGLDLFNRVVRRLVAEANRLHGPDIAEELELVANLGYFCGCRRTEAIGLTTDDVLAADARKNVKTAYETWVMVYPNGLRGVKTRAGHRDLPLHLLLPEIPLLKFRTWLGKRKVLAAGGCVPLFPSFVRANGKAHDSDPKLELIAKALRHCADDSTLRYHHLRHSFASLLLLMFWLGEEGDLSIMPEWFLPTESDRNRWKGAARLRQNLLGHAPTNRRSVLQISALMGHSGSDITFSTYIHLADFVVGRVVRRLTPKLSIETLGALSGYSVLHIRNLAAKLAYKGRAEYKAASLVDEIVNRALQGGRHRKKERTVPSVAFSNPTPVCMPKDLMERMLYVASVLNELAVAPGKSRAIASRFGCQEAELLLWQERFKALPAGMLRLNGLPSPDDAAQFLPIELPVGKALVLARKSCASIQRLLEMGISPDLKPAGAKKRLLGVFADFERNWIVGSFLDIETDSMPKATSWLWWIEQVGLRKGVRVAHFSSTGFSGESGKEVRTSVPSPARQRAHWKGGLGETKTEMADLGLRTGTSTRGGVRIGIDIRDAEKDDANYRKVTALYGIRFLIAMRQITR